MFSNTLTRFSHIKRFHSIKFEISIHNPYVKFRKKSKITNKAKITNEPETITNAEKALLFIDVQNYHLHPNGTILKHNMDEYEYLINKVEETKAKWTKLQKTCRENKIEVMYTVIESLTNDGRDRSREYVILGYHVAPGSFDAKVLECIKPGEDEIILRKTTSSVFTSTRLDYILKNMNKKELIICGTLTDQCVDHAVKDGFDLGYFITLITDCCISTSEENHQSILKINNIYCKQMALEEFVTNL